MATKKATTKPAAKAAPRKSIKKPVQPEYDQFVGSNAARMAADYWQDRTIDRFGLESLLYDMRKDYRKASKALEFQALVLTAHTAIGDIVTRVTVTRSRKESSIARGRAVFRYVLYLKDDGAQEIKTGLIVVYGETVASIIERALRELGDITQNTYDERYDNLYNNKK